MPGYTYSSEPRGWWETKPSKWQAKSFLDPFGLFHRPKPPKYKPSELELETQQYLKDIIEGKSPLFTEQDMGRRYQTLKEKMLPEFSRLGKEYDIYTARRGIEGGPQVKFRQDLAERQLQQLMDARRRIEDETLRLEQMRKSEALGQLTGMGRTRSAQEYESQMAGFQEQLMNQQDLANMLASIAMMYFGGTPAPTMYDFYQQQYGAPIGAPKDRYMGTERKIPYSYAGSGRV